MMVRMIPTIYYDDLNDGFDLFVKCLRFEVVYRDAAIAVLRRDNAQLFLVRDSVMAARDRTQITLQTDTIETLFEDIQASYASYFHPDADTITRTEWGGREFALRDSTDVCVLIRQFDDAL